MASSTKECEYMINELKRNASGYYDPTAYEAIRKVDGEMNINPGEIWETQNNGIEKQVVVLSVNDNIVSTVPLFESRKNDYEIEVNALCKKYANTAMTGYEYTNRFVSIVRLMKDEEFEKVKESVKERLGLGDFDECEKCSWQQAEKERVDDLVADVYRLREQLKEKVDIVKVLEEENKALRKTKEMMQNEIDSIDGHAITKAETERDLYKSLYESTLERLIKAV